MAETEQTAPEEAVPEQAEPELAAPPKQAVLERLESLEQFVFGAPLYKPYRLPDTEAAKKLLYKIDTDTEAVTIDGHCVSCNKEATFLVHRALLSFQDWHYGFENRNTYDQLHMTCVRDDDHVIIIWFLNDESVIQKVGQHPSLADISNDEVQKYRTAMSKEDAAEFHKAIGLAAHGVGVGSFVYLRRVFERLIDGRYNAFKAQEGWTDEEYYALKMADRVKQLKGHLPAFLVANAKIYSILSRGIHELDEETCLGVFDIMKHSIIIILDEDKKKKEELALKGKLAGAIEKFMPAAEKEN